MPPPAPFPGGGPRSRFRRRCFRWRRLRRDRPGGAATAPSAANPPAPHQSADAARGGTGPRTRYRRGKLSQPATSGHRRPGRAAPRLAPHRTGWQAAGRERPGRPGRDDRARAVPRPGGAPGAVRPVKRWTGARVAELVRPQGPAGGGRPARHGSTTGSTDAAVAPADEDDDWPTRYSWLDEADESPRRGGGSAALPATPRPATPAAGTHSAGDDVPSGRRARRRHAAGGNGGSGGRGR